MATTATPDAASAIQTRFAAQIPTAGAIDAQKPYRIDAVVTSITAGPGVSPPARNSKVKLAQTQNSIAGSIGLSRS